MSASCCHHQDQQPARDNGFRRVLWIALAVNAGLYQEDRLTNVGLMRDGRILQIGTADELYRRPVDLVAARFFSDINEFEGTAEGGVIATPLGRIIVNGKSPPGQAIVGLRPADIAVGAPATGVRGMVVARHFIGEVAHLDVAVEGVEAPVRVRLRGSERFSVGEEVGIAIDPAAALLFAKPDN